MSKQTEEITPEQYRIELIEEKARLQAELVSIKARMAKAFNAKDQQLMAEITAEKAEIVAELAEIDADLRQLKQEKQQPSNSANELNFIVQLVAAEIAYSGTFDVSVAISRLVSIKETLNTIKHQ